MKSSYANTLFNGLILTGLVMLTCCRIPVPHPPASLSAYFQSARLPDTLHIEIENENAFQGDTIPNHLFFSSIPKSLFQQIDYLADSAQSVVIARQQFPLNDHTAAYWVEIYQFWFQHHSLFLYDRNKKEFTDRITVAEWYGGDGGQVLTGSWLFDFDGDGNKDIVRREIQHSILLNGEEPTEQQQATASLLFWKDGHFTPAPFQDTAILIRRFPIRSFW